MASVSVCVSPRAARSTAYFLTLLLLLMLGVRAHATTASAQSGLRRSAVVQTVEQTSPAVVSVRTQVVVSGSRGGSMLDGFFQDFAGPRERRVETASQGSGVIIDPQGFVLTNYHVISVGGSIEIDLTDGRTLKAEVVGTSPEHDLAVLRAETKTRESLPFVRMGGSSDLMIGETVIAIGNPFGLSHTVTVGVVSALHRSIKTEEREYSDFIQTDASINPGNSGGPLLTIDAQLIGVTTAIYGKAQGIGFAIPIDKAKRIVGDLLRYGEVRRPYYGFEMQPLTSTLAETLGSADLTGVVVLDVDVKGPARGVLEEGDVVFEVDGVRVDDVGGLRLRLGDYTVESQVPLRVVRGAERLSLTLKPQALDPEDALRLVRGKLGIDAAGLSSSQAQRYGLPEGTIVVKSVAARSPAAQAGLREGDLLRAINSERVQGLQAFGKAMARNYWRGGVVLLVQRGRIWQQVAFAF